MTTETPVDLGTVRAPSGSLVLGMASWIDYWPTAGLPLSERAASVTPTGGGHLRDGLCEAVAVPAASDLLLGIRAETSRSPFDDGPTISVLEVELGLAWPDDAGDEVIALGDLPVDRCGMVVGDARALDSFSGLSGRSVDGLADVTYWGKYAEEACREFGGERIPQYDVMGPHGWLDMPLPEAEALADRLRSWVDRGPGNGLMISVDAHTDFHLFQRAGWAHPLLAGSIDVGGCPVLGLDWDPGDHSIRHQGERAWGQVYPTTLEPATDGTTVLRWRIPEYTEEAEHAS